MAAISNWPISFPAPPACAHPLCVSTDPQRTTETICSHGAGTTTRPDLPHFLWNTAPALLHSATSPRFSFCILYLTPPSSLLSFWLIGFTFITASAFSSPSLPHSTLSFNFHRYFIIFQRERWMEVITVGLLKALQFPTRLKGTAFISLLLLRPPFSTVIQSVRHSRIRRAPPMCICSERHKHTHTHQRRQRLKGELS